MSASGHRPGWTSGAHAAARLISQTLRVGNGAVPEVPHVVGDAPHVGVLPHLVNFVERGSSRRKTQHDGATGLAQSRAQHADLFSFIWTAGDAVDLHEVGTP